MKKSVLIMLAFLSCGLLQVKADEGMWLPLLLKEHNYKNMKKMGLKLSAKQLYDVNNSSLKDAIVWFNGGCTGEILSNEGLLLTNHHCGYGAINKHSTPEDNILRNGFWAKNKAEEKPNPEMFVSILVRMEEVTDKVNAGMKDVASKDFNAKFAEVSKAIIDEATKGTHYEGMVKELFRGNEYYLYVYEKFTDIRLVGTPPEAIGKFGGDTDNWMWPRHTGDFSMFRIYAGKDNKPAPFSTENVPYKPKHFLPVSTKGIKEGDFAMVYGYPGRTNRYETSYGIKMAVEETNPAIVKLRTERLELMKQQMDADIKVRLQLASKYAQIANYWKYFIGQTEQLKRLKVYERKMADEAAFQKWASDKPEYKEVLNNIQSAYGAYLPYNLHSTYLREGIQGSVLASIGAACIDMEKKIADGKWNDEEKKKMKSRLEAMYATFNPASDQKIMAVTMEMFYTEIPAGQHPEVLKKFMTTFAGKSVKETCQNFANHVFTTSMFANKDKMMAFVENPDLATLRNDPCFQYGSGFVLNYNNNYAKYAQAFNNTLNEEGKKYIKGLREMNKNKFFYPDANSTLRLTYGKVKDYYPKDGVHFMHYTTLTGVMEKAVNEENHEFEVPAKLTDLYNRKDYGSYGMNGQMPLAFITDNDITGGNSGSPVINAKGHLIGCAFDGNWEAMSGDIVFDEQYKRTINVDVRYILFLIDKYGDAPHIVAEMKLVK